MSNNERVLIGQLLQQLQADQTTPLSESDAFEFFACDQVLKTSDPSGDEVTAGVVGGNNDGGIDGVYTFVNDQLITEDSEIFEDDFSASIYGSDVPLRLVLVQAKTETSFTETALDKVSSSTKRLLNLEKTEEELRDLYSAELLGRVALFRNALKILAIVHPAVRVELTYATMGDKGSINTKVLKKAEDLEEEFSGTLSGAIGKVSFLGARELWATASTKPTYTLQLTFRENATSGTSHVALVSLRDYVAFLSAKDGELRRNIFDWNVRDFQGGVEVNREILASLQDPDAPEFWWLNNGVTIICSKVTITEKTYTLDDVQIVNGLQSSFMIFEALRDVGEDDPSFNRTVLVRILRTEDPAIRDRVIRATNRQTSVPEASLRATDDTQRNIEAYFLTRDWYYDRRKNYYRNMDKPKDRIIGIPFLAQAVMAVGLSRPNDSRARPTSLLKTDANYETIFSSAVPLRVYLWAARAQKDVDAFLLSPEANATVSERTNLHFHVAMLATARLVGKRVYSPMELSMLAENDIKVGEADLHSCLERARETMRELVGQSGEAGDKIAKGREFVDALLGAEGY